jgi:cytochrome c oxidase subunit IV
MQKQPTNQSTNHHHHHHHQQQQLALSLKVMEFVFILSQTQGPIPQEDRIKLP